MSQFSQARWRILIPGSWVTSALLAGKSLWMALEGEALRESEFLFLRGLQLLGSLL